MKPQSHPAAGHAAARSKPARLLCSALISTLAAFAPAQADTINFETIQNVTTPSLAPGDTIYNTGDAFREAGFTMQLLNSASAGSADYGLLGAQVTGSNLDNCFALGCPVGNASKYFAGLNDAVLALSRTDALAFKISSLRFAFVAPLSGLYDFSHGQLTLTGSRPDGSSVSTSRDFGSPDSNGNYTFSDWILAPSFSNTALLSLTANACLYDAAGACITTHDLLQNQGQFALDDLHVGVVPEPSAYLMMLLGLAGMGLLARRRPD